MAHYDPTSLKAEDFIHHEEILDTSGMPNTTNTTLR